MVKAGRRAVPLLVVAALAGLLTLVSASPQASALAETCRLRQLTHTHVTHPGAPHAPQITADGRRVIFATQHDLVAGQNPDRSQELFEVDTVTGATRQLTRLPQGTYVLPVAASADGSIVFYWSNRSTPGNPDRSDALFRSDRTTGTVELIADDLQGTTADRGFSADDEAQRLAFVASWDHEGQNPDGSREVWLYDHSSRTISARTSGPADGRAPSGVALSGNGTTVAFVSGRDELGDGSNADGSFEAFVLDLDTDALVQRTDAVGQAGANEVSLDHDGDRLAIVSEASLFGPVPDGGANLAIVDPWSDHAVEVFGSTDPGFHFGFTELDGAGERVLVAEPHRLVVRTPGQAPAVVQPRSGLTAARLSADGATVAFTSGEDLVGQNGDRNTELYVADCRQFTDVGPGHPFWREIDWAGAEGIVAGYADQTFRPGAPVSRQAAAAFLHRLAGSPDVAAPTPSTFSDVGAGHPFRDEVEWAAGEGITQGYGDGTFRPLAPVTRQAMAAFLFAFADADDFDLPDEPTFDDVSLSHPFAEPIEWAADAGIVHGYADRTFRPAATVTRQGAAAFLHRLATPA